MEISERVYGGGVGGWWYESEEEEATPCIWCSQVHFV